LKESKENLLLDQYIILADFSENYSFMLQDAIKGFLLGKQSSSSSLFPYLYQRSTLQTFSFCVICDGFDQNTLPFYAFQRILVQYLCTIFHNLKKVMYVSDGSAAQYKMRKNLSTSTVNKILVSLLNGTSSQQAMGRDSEKAGCKDKSTKSVQ
jgi:hypothetical protein